MTAREWLNLRIAKRRDELAGKVARLESGKRVVAELLQDVRSDRERLYRLLSESESLESEGQR